MNFMNGRIIKLDGKFYFDEGRFKVKVAGEMAPGIAGYEGKEIIFGIRPEDIYDKLFAQNAPPENMVKAVVEVIEPMGSEVHLHLNSGKNTFVAKVGGHNKPAVNQAMDLVFDTGKAHFFDPKTDIAID